MRSYLLPLLAGAMLLLAGYHVLHSQQPPQKTSPPLSPAKSPFANRLAGLGIVESSTENIAIGPHVSGVVERLHVKVGQRVRPGDLLLEVDARRIQAEIQVQEAKLAAAEAQLAKLQQMPRKEELPPSAARVQEAKANLLRYEDAFRRSQKLVDSRAIPEEEMIRNRQLMEAAQANLAQQEAQDQLLRSGAWEPDLAVARAAVEQARAELAEARVERERHRVLAPHSSSARDEDTVWEVLQANVRPGEFVGTPPSEPLLVLGDTGPRNVRVDIDEYDIPRFRSSAPAVAFARGGADRPYPLRFVRVEPFVVPKRSLSGDVGERVDTRVLQVLYELADDDRSVYVGQQMDVFIDLGEAPATAATVQAQP